jgi:hypothetical protein
MMIMFVERHVLKTKKPSLFTKAPHHYEKTVFAVGGGFEPPRGS